MMAACGLRRHVDGDDECSFVHSLACSISSTHTHLSLSFSTYIYLYIYLYLTGILVAFIAPRERSIDRPPCQFDIHICALCSSSSSKPPKMARLFYILVSSFVVLSVFFTATIVQHATDAEDFLHRRVLFEQLRTNNMELDLMHTRARADDVQRKLVAESNVVSELSATLHELQDQNEQLREQLEFAQEAVAELKRKQARFGSQTGLAATLVVDDEDDPLYVLLRARLTCHSISSYTRRRSCWHGARSRSPDLS